MNIRLFTVKMLAPHSVSDFSYSIRKLEMMNWGVPDKCTSGTPHGGFLDEKNSKKS